MHQSVGSRKDLYKGTKVHDFANSPLIDGPNLSLLNNILDHLQGLFPRFFINTKDLDKTGIIYVDPGVRFRLHGPDHFAARADDIPYLVRIDMYGQDLGRIRGNFLPGLFDGLLHLVQENRNTLRVVLTITVHMNDDIVIMQKTDPKAGDERGTLPQTKGMADDSSPMLATNLC